jgi:hypothetical protein
MLTNFKIGAAAIAGMFGLIVGSQSASATFTTTLDFSFGAGGNDGYSMDITVEDTDTDEVTLTFDLTGLFAGSKVKDIYMNFDNPALTPGDFGAWSGDAPTGIQVCGAAPDCATVNPFKADGDGFYDLYFAFSPSMEGFAAGEATSSVITLTGISMTSFNGLSTGGDKGAFCAAAHILSGVNDDSDYLGSSTCGDMPPPPGGEIPEPATLGTLALGLLGLGLLGRRRRASR